MEELERRVRNNEMDEKRYDRNHRIHYRKFRNGGVNNLGI